MINKSKMKKQGQIFSLFLVFITLFMVGVSVSLYSIQQKNIQNSLVSPLSVLNVRDARNIFDMRERSLIVSSLKKTNGKFGTEKFLREFRSNVISGVTPKMKEFIFSNLSWKGTQVSNFNKESFLENIVYCNSCFSGAGSSVIVFRRGNIDKSFDLRALDRYKVNFVVGFNFNLTREYIISKKDGKFNVEVK